MSHAASNSSDGRAVLPQKQLPEAKSYINLLSFLQMDVPSPPPSQVINDQPLKGSESITYSMEGLAGLKTFSFRPNDN